jgi:hypothetical protein
MSESNVSTSSQVVEQTGYQVLTHQQQPKNDPGGLAVGGDLIHSSPANALDSLNLKPEELARDTTKPLARGLHFDSDDERESDWHSPDNSDSESEWDVNEYPDDTDDEAELELYADHLGLDDGEGVDEEEDDDCSINGGSDDGEDVATLKAGTANVEKKVSTVRVQIRL